MLSSAGHVIVCDVRACVDSVAPQPELIQTSLLLQTPFHHTSTTHSPLLEMPKDDRACSRSLSKGWIRLDGTKQVASKSNQETLLDHC